MGDAEATECWHSKARLKERCWSIWRLVSHLRTHGAGTGTSSRHTLDTSAWHTSSTRTHTHGTREAKHTLHIKQTT